MLNLLEFSRPNFDRAQRNNSPASSVTLSKLVGGDTADPENIWNRAKAIEVLLEHGRRWSPKNNLF